MFLIILVFLLAAGCGKKKPRFTEEQLAKIPLPQRTNLPLPSGGFVLAVGNDTVTGDEVIAPLMSRLAPAAQTSSLESFKLQAGAAVRKSLMNRISDILLYQKAESEAGENVEERLEKAVEAETRKFIISFEGDYAKAEQFLKEEMGMNWYEFKEHQKRMILGGSYLHQKLPKPKPVTYSDLMDYYNDMKEKIYSTPAAITIRLIDIEIAKLKLDDPNSSGLEQADKLADELVKRLGRGEDFGELAKQYSNGYRAAAGGLWKPINPDSLAKPYDVLAKEAEKLEVGQIAGPIETDKHIFIMKLQDKQTENVEPFEKVQKQIEQRILMERRRKAFNEVMGKLIEEAALADVDKFIDFCIEKIYADANL
jgi:parvulin-like peptidyl-prolyl isomerase